MFADILNHLLMGKLHPKGIYFNSEKIVFNSKEDPISAKI